tara:strand:- start:91 stop:1419 length:1329 start_codon:yes stop_codon:yes gene_type:complete
MANEHKRETWTAGVISFGGKDYPIAAGDTYDAAPVGVGGYLTEGERYVVFWEKGDKQGIFQTSLESTYDRASKNRLIVAELQVPSNAASAGNFTDGNDVQIDIKADGQIAQFTDTAHVWQGSAALPAYSFSGDVDTGMYSDTADQIQFSTGGTQRLEISSSGITVTGDVSSTNMSATGWFRGDVGTISAPEFSFSADTDTGIYRSAADALAFTAGGESLSLTGAIRSSDSVHFLGLAPTNVMDGTDGDAWFNIGTYPTTANAYNFRPINSIASYYHYGGWTGSATTPVFTYWYDSHTGIYFPSDDAIGISAGGTQKLLYDSGWYISLSSSSGGSSYRDVQVHNSTDSLVQITSSARYKENIEDLTIDTTKIYDLNPVSFNGIGETETTFGLIAEEVDKVIPELVGYDKENRPESVSYSRLPILLLAEIKNLKEEIKELKEKN